MREEIIENMKRHTCRENMIGPHIAGLVDAASKRVCQVINVNSLSSKSLEKSNISNSSAIKLRFRFHLIPRIDVLSTIATFLILISSISMQQLEHQLAAQPLPRMRVVLLIKPVPSNGQAP